MPYRIRSAKNPQKRVRKIAREQVRKALAEIEDTDMDIHTTVHQVRKRCKKLRGLIRLVRPQFENYKKENRKIRDAARRLSAIRDAQSVLNTVDTFFALDLVSDDENIGSIRAEFENRKIQLESDTSDLPERIASFKQDLKKLHQRIDCWKIGGNSFSSFSGGLEKTYRRGRDAFTRAYESPSTEQFHDWRKRVKYHWYHLRLLSDVWPEQMRVQRKAADKLGDLLGNEHDLAVLRQSLLKEPAAFGRPKNIRRVADCIDQQRERLREQARQLGPYLYAEKPSCLSKRIGSYWSALGETENGGNAR